MMGHKSAARRHPLHGTALFGALSGAFMLAHRLADQWVQDSGDAVNKDAHGAHLVYADGVEVGAEPDGQDRTGWPTMTATQLGRRCAARHVATYTAVQTAAAAAVTGLLGRRLPARALLAAAAINSATHYVIDRRAPLLKLAELLGKTGYIDHCQAVRRLPDGALTVEQSGPGTAVMELDQALHELCGGVAALVATVLAVRAADRE
ncbi:hypothetical protein GCM10017673_37580 [Streptosporangium violaceochromogenes]|nr:hypothetical protein GCM10017673_37580 [Streptosporangium violaceochromogenes]